MGRSSFRTVAVIKEGCVDSFYAMSSLLPDQEKQFVSQLLNPSGGEVIQASS